VTDFANVTLLWLLAAVAIIGALSTVLAREVMRIALGLGAFLLALAGLFAYFGFGFLALAELFVYVGGVLILILFAIMLVHRTGEGRTQLALRNPATPALAALLTSGLLFWMLRSLDSVVGGITASGTPADLARELLGPLLPQFEIAGALLLVALVAVVLVSGGERE
jgi:NADH:ubiquinone oxidoreductase subunit 6 (subunit J)